MVVLISTHTPLTGRDSNPMWYKGGDNISTHTPLTGRDMLSSALNSCPKIFLLTRPLRDVTPDEPKPDEPKPISTHTPLTGRDNSCSFAIHTFGISTHTPLTGRDRYILYLCNGTFPHIGTDLFLLISFI